MSELWEQAPLLERYRYDRYCKECTVYMEIIFQFISAIQFVFLIVVQYVHMKAMHYDEVSDLRCNWVAQRPDFKIAPRVVKWFLTPNVINIYGLQYDFMQKSRKKHSKTQNRLFYNVNSAPELKNDQKLP